MQNQFSSIVNPKDTGNIDVDLIEKKITKKNKSDNSCSLFLESQLDMEKDSLQLCKKYKIKLIEDCALALGAKYKNKHVGRFW